MLSDLLNLFIILFFVFYGIKRPVVALCGVLWVDVYKPQSTSYSFLNGLPLSMIMSLFFFMVFFLSIKKIKVPKSPVYHFFVISFMVWITITSVYSQFPTIAWMKHDIAFKTILFAYFIPFVLVDKKAIETFLWIIIPSFGAFVFMAGTKTFMGGGGYGIALAGDGGFMWAEGSTLATQAVSLLPIFWYSMKNTELVLRYPYMKYILWGYSFCALLTLIGTQARTGIVCIAVLLFLIVMKTKQKVKNLLLLSIIPLIILPFAGSDYFERMDTISSSEAAANDASAQGRVVVWRWTLDYVAEKPFMGGGFYAYRANAGQLDAYSDSNEVTISTPHPKAFHSIIFEVLGGHGYVGLFLFLGIITHLLFINNSPKKQNPESRGDKTNWQFTLAKTINVSILVYCAGGLFIGVAFYPWLYYMYGLKVALTAE